MNIPEGWKLVPEEPTSHMKVAGEEWAEKGFNWPAAIYRAMTRAAPTPPSQEDEPTKSWKPVGEAINTFLSEYECYDGIEVDHKPTEPELFLIADAVNGLLSDEAFKEAYGTWLYTHPDNSKLRKAAEEVCDWKKIYGTHRLWPLIENLRAALEEK